VQEGERKIRENEGFSKIQGAVSFKAMETWQ